MSARILSLVVLMVVLLVLGCAVVATAQEIQPLQPGVAPGTVPQHIGPPADQPTAQPMPQAPFTLSPEEDANLNRLLTDWQNMSGNVKTFEATFMRWDYDGVFGNGQDPKRKIDGNLKYAAPDKGFYALSDDSERWICTGTAVYEFQSQLKQVREYPLPQEMQGKAIADGPLPFVFGVEAAKMKARYWLRIKSFPNQQANQVGLECYPKQAKDAANFYKVDVILTFVVENGVVVKLEPYAINMTLPNQKDRTAYVFTSMSNNSFLNNLSEFLKIFIRPATPLGWQHVVMDDKQLPGIEGQPQLGQPGVQPAGRPAANIGTAPPATVPR